MHRKIIIAIFILILISPFIGWIAGAKIELEENRNLANAPELTVQGVIKSNYFSDVEKFYNDHFAYRAMLVKMKSWIDFHVFRTSPSSRVHLGRDGWLYYYRANHDYFKIDDCNPDEVKRMRFIARQLHELERMVEVSGRKFVFVIAPDKSTVYPEYFGIRRQESGCNKSRYDLLLDAFNEYPVKNFIRLDNLLSQAKYDRQVYYKTDTHWNLYGSMIASSAILRHLTPVTWREYFPEVKMGEQSYSGDLSKMIALDLSESTGVIENIHYGAEVKEVNFGRYMNGNRFRFIASPHSGKHLLPKAIIYHDSYSTRLLPFLKGSFEQLDAVWSNNLMTRLTPEPVNNLRDANIVIVEVAEMYLPGFVVDLRAWNEGLFNKKS